MHVDLFGEPIDIQDRFERLLARRESRIRYRKFGTAAAGHDYLAEPKPRWRIRKV